MWSNRADADKREDAVAVAIDKDKGSQYALKWTVDHLLSRGQNVTLLHVKIRQSSIPSPTGTTVAISDVSEDVVKTFKNQGDNQAREIFLPFRVFCTRKDIKCKEIILEDTDITKALIDYAHLCAVAVMVVGASSRNGLVSRKFKGPDIATNVTKAAPEFCTVYVISKGKMMSVRTATRPVPRLQTSPSQSQISTSATSEPQQPNSARAASRAGEKSQFSTNNVNEESDSIRSPFTRRRAANGRSYGELSLPESDISYVSSNRPSSERMSIDRAPYERGSFDVMDFANGPRLSNASDFERMSFGSSISGRRSSDFSMTDSSSNYSAFSASSTTNMQEDVESEMRRLRLELKQTMEMYNTACKEALTAKQKALDIQKSKVEEDQKMEEARVAEEAAMAMAENEKIKCRAALEAAEAAQKLAELEAKKRGSVESRSRRDSEEKTKAIDGWTPKDVRYRKYSIEEIEIATEYFSEARKIGEGGYGPVYRCTLDHTPVAIKVLRPDAAQGQSQFQQEVEILSCIRHPNMVLLLGACPEYGCLVYEYMSNGSLEDCLFSKKSPPLPWQLRFRIAAEIGTGLLFLHQSKPEPLVHRDLKPGNILLDRNYVSKISDVGLARLVPPSIADNVTQYRMTQTAGTFCYIDPEYQQTGMLGTKSDIYSLGILFLQLITAKPAMGLTHHVQRSIERGTFGEMLDPAIPDWPYEEALHFAQFSLKCAELRKKDRPDLARDLLPELNRLREFAEDNMQPFMFSMMPSRTPMRSHASTIQDEMSANQSPQSGLSAASSALSAGSCGSCGP